MLMGSLLDLALPAIVNNLLNKATIITVNAQGQPLTIKDPLNNIAWAVLGNVTEADSR